MIQLIAQRGQARGPILGNRFGGLAARMSW
jgi:hypothetical protein